MTLLDILALLADFAAPALVLALLLPLAARLLVGRVRRGPSWWLQVLVNFVAGVLALGAGLWYFGHDGKLASYGALVAAAASSQWLLARAWR